MVLIKYNVLGDQNAIIAQRGHKASRIDGQVLRGAGRTEVDEGFGIREAKCRESNVSAMGPGAAVIGVEDNVG